MLSHTNTFFRRTLFLSAVLVQFLLGIAAETAHAASPCNDISIAQKGVEITAKNGTIRIQRLPFTVKYKNPVKDPSITLSTTPALNQGLQASGHNKLLGSAGDYMALYPNDLVLLDEFSLFDNAEGRKTFAELLGAAYPAYVEKLVSERPELSLATSIPKAASGFEYNQTDKSHDYLVNKINSVPVQEVQYSSMYLTYFGVLDDLPMTPEQAADLSFLQVNSWGACTIVFK